MVLLKELNVVPQIVDRGVLRPIISGCLLINRGVPINLEAVMNSPFTLHCVACMDFPEEICPHLILLIRQDRRTTRQHAQTI